MAVVHEKRGSKDIPHYFHTLKERDGSKKRVYLGSDPYAANKRIVALNNSRLKDDPVFAEADDLKHRLNKIAEHGRPIETKLQDVKQTYYAQKHFDKMLEPHRRKRLEIAAVVTLSFTGLLLGILLMDSPSITGVSVLDQNMSQVITTPFAGMIITAVLVILLGATVLHAKLHLRYKKLKKYQQ